jgi:hypothetical protein
MAEAMSEARLARLSADNEPRGDHLSGLTADEVGELLDEVGRLRAHVVAEHLATEAAETENDRLRAQLAEIGELTPAGHEYRAQGVFMHEVTEEHARSYPDGWANDYRLEIRPLYAGAWHEPESDDWREVPE